jgi:UDPglucose--hexose-1-phosphate uridylyltransferase
MPNPPFDEMASEVRFDDFTGRLVIVARVRRKRPHFYREDLKEEDKGCPFCPGHENETPKASLLYILEGGRSILKTFDENDLRRSDWSVRVFPNMFPALNTGLKSFRPGSLNSYGYHEVVVENPDHFWRYETADLRSIELPLLALIDRGRFMESDQNVRHIAIFKNQGKEAGASITHPHYQIIGSSFIPPLVSRELESFSRIIRVCGKCYFCELDAEAQESGRLVSAGEYFTVITPFASIFPYECWIVPKHHASSFLESSDEEVRDLAIILKGLFSSYKRVFGIFSFNMVFHSRPVGNEDFHWHVEIYPRVVIHAGYELGSGAYINVVGPEEAALQLRQALPASTNV